MGSQARHWLVVSILCALLTTTLVLARDGSIGSLERDSSSAAARARSGQRLARAEQASYNRIGPSSRAAEDQLEDSRSSASGDDDPDEAKEQRLLNQAEREAKEAEEAEKQAAAMVQESGTGIRDMRRVKSSIMRATRRAERAEADAGDEERRISRQTEDEMQTGQDELNKINQASDDTDQVQKETDIEEQDDREEEDAREQERREQETAKRARARGRFAEADEAQAAAYADKQRAARKKKQADAALMHEAEAVEKAEEDMDSIVPQQKAARSGSRGMGNSLAESSRDSGQCLGECLKDCSEECATELKQDPNAKCTMNCKKDCVSMCKEITATEDNPEEEPLEEGDTAPAGGDKLEDDMGPGDFSADEDEDEDDGEEPADSRAVIKKLTDTGCLKDCHPQCLRECQAEGNSDEECKEKCTLSCEDDCFIDKEGNAPEPEEDEDTMTPEERKMEEESESLMDKCTDKCQQSCMAPCLHKAGLGGMPARDVDEDELIHLKDSSGRRYSTEALMGHGNCTDSCMDDCFMTCQPEVERYMMEKRNKIISSYSVQHNAAAMQEKDDYSRPRVARRSMIGSQALQSQRRATDSDSGMDGLGIDAYGGMGGRGSRKKVYMPPTGPSSSPFNSWIWRGGMLVVLVVITTSILMFAGKICKSGRSRGAQLTPL